jgi:hypothetical protein
MKKGDKQFDVGYGQGGGGGAAGAYKGPSGGSAPSGYGGLGGPAINHKTSFRMGYESGMRDQRNAEGVKQRIESFARQEATRPVPKSAIGSKSEVRVDKTLAKTGIAAGVAGAAGYSIAKKKKDSNSYRKNPRMVAPPKINLRKAYED